MNTNCFVSLRYISINKTSYLAGKKEKRWQRSDIHHMFCIQWLILPVSTGNWRLIGNDLLNKRQICNFQIHSEKETFWIKHTKKFLIFICFFFLSYFIFRLIWRQQNKSQISRQLFFVLVTSSKFMPKSNRSCVGNKNPVQTVSFIKGSSDLPLKRKKKVHQINEN